MSALPKGMWSEKLSLRCMTSRAGFNRVEPHASLIFLIKHGFFGKLVSTFPDRALVASISGHKQSWARRKTIKTVPLTIERRIEADEADLTHESLVTMKADRRKTRGPNSPETSQPSSK
jgi:hypothetical protein